MADSSPRRSRPDQLLALEGREPRAHGAAARARGRDGADLVLLPEKWNGLGSHEILLDVAEPLEGGETVEAMSGWARTHGITPRRRLDRRAARRAREALEHVCRLRSRGRDRSGLPEDPHVRRRGRRGRLPRVRQRGAGRPAGELRGRGLVLGLTVCYDLRYPELHRILAVEGAELVTVPAAFTLHTGKDHWEILLRARAVENQCYVVAANQWGVVEGKASYGRSSIVDPWGVVLAQAPTRTESSRPSSTAPTWSESGAACRRSPTASPPLHVAGGV